MEKIISSTDNKISINGSRYIRLLEAFGLNDANLLNLPGVSFIISEISCDGVIDNSRPISFLNLIDNPKMQKKPTVIDFGNDTGTIKNKNLKTEIKFIVSENLQFKLFYEIEHFHNKLYPMKLNRDLDKIKCIKDCEENKGLTWHVNLHSVHDSKDIFNELNNMYLFSGDNEEAIRFYQLLIQNDFNGQFNDSEAHNYSNYKYVYVYSSKPLSSGQNT